MTYFRPDWVRFGTLAEKLGIWAPTKPDHSFPDLREQNEEASVVHKWTDCEQGRRDAKFDVFAIKPMFRTPIIFWFKNWADNDKNLVDGEKDV